MSEAQLIYRARIGKECRSFPNHWLRPVQGSFLIARLKLRYLDAGV